MQYYQEIIVALTAMAPLSELRGALPLAIGVFHFSPVKAFLVSVIANAVPPFFIILLMEWITKRLMRFTWWNGFFTRLFNHTREKFRGDYERWGELALVIFVAIPLPATGAWSGALAAWLFGIPMKRAVPLIALGVAIAGLIVLGLTQGVAALI